MFGSRRRWRRCLEALEAPAGTLVVMDRGVATAGAIGWLRDNGYRIWWWPPAPRRFDPDTAVQIQTRSEKTLRLYKEVNSEGDEVRLHCFSEERAAKERAIVERISSRFEAALTGVHEGLARPRTRKPRLHLGADRADQEEPLACLGPLRHRGDRFGGRPKGRRHQLGAPSTAILTHPGSTACGRNGVGSPLFDRRRLPVRSTSERPATIYHQKPGVPRAITVVVSSSSSSAPACVPGVGWRRILEGQTASPPPSPGAHCICARPPSPSEVLGATRRDRLTGGRGTRQSVPQPAPSGKPRCHPLQTRRRTGAPEDPAPVRPVHKQGRST